MGNGGNRAGSRKALVLIYSRYDAGDCGGSRKALVLIYSRFDAGLGCGVAPDQRFWGRLGRRGCAHVRLASAPQAVLHRASLGLGALLQRFASRLPRRARWWRANSFE